MNERNRRRRDLLPVAALLGVALLTSCGSDPTGPGARDGVTAIELASDDGDYIGQGETYSYSQANALITVKRVSSGISITVEGDEDWTGAFRPRDAATRPEVGRYDDAVISWEGDHRACGTTNGWFEIESVAYEGERLVELELHFVQFCRDIGTGPALHGDVSWSAYDTTVPPGPVDPPPSDLWQPNAASLPTAGNYLYLVSAPGDYIGQGEEHLFSPPGEVFDVYARGGHLAFVIEPVRARGSFQVMNVIDRIQPGYYPGLQREGFSNPYTGGFSLGLGSRGCNRSRSWVVVDDVEFDGEDVAHVQMRFEQYCDNGAAPIRGVFRWTR